MSTRTSLFRKIKVSLAKMYLDWVEKLPKFRGGLVESLQLTREHQRKWSEECYKSSRAPDGAKIKYKELVLIEVFELEELSYLSDGIKKLFPNIKRSSNIIEKLEKDVGTLFSAGSYRVGTVSTSPMMPSLDNTIDPALPSCINYVSIWLFGITPSVYAVAFTFSMTKKVTADLINLHSRHYLSDVIFKKLIPRGPIAGGHSENAVDTVMQRSILDYLRSIRKDCENWISKYMKGRLLNELTHKGNSLGAIEVFEISGVPLDSEESLKQWKDKAHSWGDSFGIPISDSTNFVHNQYSFCWESLGRERQSIPARVLISNEYEYSHLEYILSSLVAPLAIISYLKYVRRMIEIKRVDVYRAIMKFSNKLNRKNIKNSLLLKRGLMIIDRLKMELSHNKNWFLHLMESIDEFKSDKKYFGDKTLDSVLAERINSEMDYVEKHVRLAEKNISEYISMQNIFVMFLLQKRMFLLTIVVTLATIVGLLINYEYLVKVWNFLTDLI